MNNKEDISSARIRRKMEPEKYDLVILAGVTGSTIAA
jgi:hypothetical protein